jgi:hypothetical protein
VVPFWDSESSSRNAGPPLGQRRNERNLNSLFIMNSAGEEDEEQVDYGEDSGEESSMSFNGQARSTTWRRMLCPRCIPAASDLLPGSGSRSTSRSSESRTSPARACAIAMSAMSAYRGLDQHHDERPESRRPEPYCQGDRHRYSWDRTHPTRPGSDPTTSCSPSRRGHSSVRMRSWSIGPT